MDLKIVYLSESKLYLLDEKGQMELTSQYYEKYRRSISEIRKKNAWKTSGSGAAFMGLATRFGEGDEGDDITAAIDGAVFAGSDKLIYTLNAGNNTGLYIKNPGSPQDAEGFILREDSMYIYEMDYDPEKGRIIASVSEDRMTRNLCLFNEENPRYQILTEGDCFDRNPCFSKTGLNVIYYDSAGLSIDNEGGFNSLSNRSILSLDLQSGSIQEEVAQEGFDCMKPWHTGENALYYLKRPVVKTEGKQRSPLSLAKDIILAPVKVVKAVIGWLNLFTQRYSGESLKTGGPNPAKSKQKTQADIFIENNLINASKNLKENTDLGEKYPGIAPKSWQIIKRLPNGNEQVMKKGVLDYAVLKDGSIIYANGKNLVKMSPEGEETLLTQAGIVTGIRVYE